MNIMATRAIRMCAVVSLVTLLLIDLTTSQEVTAGSTSRPPGRGGGPRANRNRPNNNNRTGGGRGRDTQESGGSAGQCETVEVPMCKGLVGYTQTKLPNRFNHTTQLQVYRVLEHMWALMDRGCSHNLRLLACSLYLPKCAGARRPGQEPCAATCTHTKRMCEARLQQFGYTWPQQLVCEDLPKKNCLRKANDHSCSQDYTLCTPIDLPMCTGLGLRYTHGLIPNMFGQCRAAEISAEMQQFRPLLASGCSARLGLFLCAVYTPFCSGQPQSIADLVTFPCRELCQEVRDACSAAYARLSGGLPWPNKFQCHRYPEGASGNLTCVMSNEADGLIHARPLPVP